MEGSLWRPGIKIFYNRPMWTVCVLDGNSKSNRVQQHGRGALAVSKLASRNFTRRKVPWIPLTLLSLGDHEKHQTMKSWGVWVAAVDQKNTSTQMMWEVCALDRHSNTPASAPWEGHFGSLVTKRHSCYTPCECCAPWSVNKKGKISNAMRRALRQSHYKNSSLLQYEKVEGASLLQYDRDVKQNSELQRTWRRCRRWCATKNDTPDNHGESSLVPLRRKACSLLTMRWTEKIPWARSGSGRVSNLRYRRLWHEGDV